MSDRIIHYKSMEDYIMDNELLYSKNKYRNIYIENELYCNLKILYNTSSDFVKYGCRRK